MNISSNSQATNQFLIKGVLFCFTRRISFKSPQHASQCSLLTSTLLIYASGHPEVFRHKARPFYRRWKAGQSVRWAGRKGWVPGRREGKKGFHRCSRRQEVIQLSLCTHMLDDKNRNDTIKQWKSSRRMRVKGFKMNKWTCTACLFVILACLNACRSVCWSNGKMWALNESTSYLKANGFMPSVMEKKATCNRSKLNHIISLGAGPVWIIIHICFISSFLKDDDKKYLFIRWMLVLLVLDHK